jgi:hypothetical protein
MTTYEILTWKQTVAIQPPVSIRAGMTLTSFMGAGAMLTAQQGDCLQLGGRKEEGHSHIFLLIPLESTSQKRRLV